MSPVQRHPTPRLGMMYLIIPCLILALVCASSARAETDVFSPANRLSRPVKAFAPLLGKRFVAKCRMGYCQWLRLENARLIGRSTRGELYEITTRRWGSGPHAEYKGRVQLKDRGKQTTYVFCSKTMPAWVSTTEKRKEAGFFQEQAPSQASPRRCTPCTGQLATAPQPLKPVWTQSLVSALVISCRTRMVSGAR